jgi:hypothetical protein
MEKNRAVINFSIIENAISQDTNLAATWDISINGARLFTNKYFPVETKLIISLDLSRTELLVRLWAKVKWVNEVNNNMGKYEMGVEFIHSVQSLPELLKHLHGHELIESNQRNSRVKKLLPVEVTEAP